MNYRFAGYFKNNEVGTLTKHRAAVYWTLQTVILPDDENAEINLVQAATDLLKDRKTYNWNEQSQDYHPLQSEKEFDALCIHIQKNTGVNPEALSIYKFIAIIEALSNSQQPS